MIKQCEKCKHKENLNGGIVGCLYMGADCRKGEMFDPITNADRIRLMTDEEIADIMSMHTATGACNDWGIPHEKCGGSCRECIIDWLKQPAEPPKEE